MEPVIYLMSCDEFHNPGDCMKSPGSLAEFVLRLFRPFGRRGATGEDFYAI